MVEASRANQRNQATEWTRCDEHRWFARHDTLWSFSGCGEFADVAVSRHPSCTRGGWDSGLLRHKITETIVTMTTQVTRSTATTTTAKVTTTRSSEAKAKGAANH